jgi:uncharacterized membrane protein YkvA (DUF1232 family)
MPDFFDSLIEHIAPVIYHVCMFNRMLQFLKIYPKLVVDPRVPAKTKYLPLIALAYFLVPIDLIPDFFLLLGQLDDIGVIVILLNMAIRAFEQSPAQQEKKKYGKVIDVEAIKKG